MKKHFVFQNGEVITYSYNKGDIARLELLSDLNIQTKHFPDKIDGELVNPLVEVIESELDYANIVPETNPLNDIEPDATVLPD